MPVPDLTNGIPNTAYAYQPPAWFFDKNGTPPAGAPGVFNILDYGAVADPSVNNTAAIQAAIDAANAAGGGVVWVPPGVYGIGPGTKYPGKSGAIFLESNVYLKGAGMEHGAGGATSSFRVVDGTTTDMTGLIRTNPSNGTSNYGASDITIDGNRDAAPAGIVIGLLTGVKAKNGDGIPDKDVTFLRVEIKDCSSYGFDPHEVTERLLIDSCVAHGNGKDGFVADHLVDSVYRNNLAFDNDRHGFNLQTTTVDMLMENNVAYGNGSSGLTIQRGNYDVPLSRDITVRGDKYYGNAKEGIVVRLSEDIRIENVDVYENGTYGIRIKGSDDVSIKNSKISNNSQAGNNLYSNIQILDEYDPYTSSIFGSLRTTITNNTFNATSAIKPRYSVEEKAGVVDFTVVANNVINDPRNTPDVSLFGANSTFDGDVSSDAPDVFKGDSRNDFFDGKGGADNLAGTAGNDTLLGGDGNDTLDGGTGNDSLMGGADNDTIKAGDGNDFVDGGTGNDTINGGKNNDTITGGEGNDTLIGDSGDDTFFEGAGSDIITGGGGIDTLDFSFAAAAVTIDAGLGKATSGLDVDSFNSVERFVGSALNDTLLGGSKADYLAGGNGNDVLRGKAGSDTMVGGDGEDTFVWFKPDVVSGTNDKITDFNKAFDVLDISELLKGAVYSTIGDVVSLTAGAAGTQLAVKIGGAGSFVNVAHLDGVSGLDAAVGVADGWLLT